MQLLFLRGAALAGLALCSASAAPAPNLLTASVPARERVAKPRARSIEYRLSWGVRAIGADRAYARGSTGRGVTVALIDTGVAGATADVLRNVAEGSTDLVAGRRAPEANGRHGAQTAGIVAAALDGSGTMGVAYSARVLSIRADIDGSCAVHCAVRGPDLAGGIDYALRAGARVIAVPLVGPRPLPSVEAALARAAASGAVIVAAAGNGGQAEPSWPARYASDPRFGEAILVAGASTIRGAPARWSNRAGQAAERFLLAPGENILVDCGKRWCFRASGTSYSVSYVAGALALLLDRYPDLSPRQAAARLLQGARDLGARGVDPAHGRGLLDVPGALRAARGASAA